MSRLSRIRLLPVLIFVAMLTLSVRIGALWDDVGQRAAMGDIVGTRAAHAQSAPNAPDAAAQPPGASGAPAASASAAGAGTGTPALPDAPGATTADGGNAGSAAASQDDSLKALFSRDPTTFTPSEIALLQRLNERREALDRQAHEQERREAMLVAAERQIESKIGELRRLETSIQDLLAKQSEQEKARLEALVGYYQSMKPADAANILNGMDTALVVDLILAMKRQSAALILANMEPVKAREVSQSVAHRRIDPVAAPAPRGG
ncbi:hypothetical protein IHV25_08965 [Phaeovibrio sulfidiphilus]|uniref:Magnesium transporter MgtE intracellular domain-containing protein n=1 Tax=Phaeovibrio sulfidiphilus TaxID=1220600 RepID=A0A8J6YJX2_9PROT|nr:hypothetical protein [Phaeovibrio sulfidiphilus]MBE1237776.1 hypothetical protein [Phaeovibrio sulfidiphilus]